MRTLLIASLFALIATPALAQDASPSSAPTAATAAPTPVAKKKAPVAATPAASPAPSATALSEDARRENNAVADLDDEVSYRVSRAKSRIERGPIAEGQKGEITRALDRAVEQIANQQKRVDDAKAAVDPGSLDHVSRLQEEIAAMSKIAHVAAHEVEAVRTHDSDTEDTLQATSDELDKISDRGEELGNKLEEVRDGMQDRADQLAEAHGIGVIKGKHGTVHVGVNTENERVEFGRGVEIKKDEKVESAVAFGGPITIAGDVEGDAVAFGGNLHVTESGHVHGDAASFGGRIIIDEGGRVDGEKTQVGAGKMVAGMIPALAAADAPERHLSTGATIGFGLLRAAAEFLCFFLLGMLVLVLVPKRTLVVAEAIERHPLKAGGIGFAVMVAALPLTLLLIITILGIPLAILLWPALFVSGFFGYVALALVIGRKLPAGVIPTNNALFALGAAVIVAVGMLPWIGSAIWFLLGFLAIGAVALTRFGAEDKSGPASSTLEAAA